MQGCLPEVGLNFAKLLIFGIPTEFEPVLHREKSCFFINDKTETLITREGITLDQAAGNQYGLRLLAISDKPSTRAGIEADKEEITGDLPSRHRSRDLRCF